MPTAIILFAHGARDPAWANPLHRVQAAIRQRVGGVPVELAFLELMTPTLPECAAALVAGGVAKIVVQAMADAALQSAGLELKESTAC